MGDDSTARRKALEDAVGDLLDANGGDAVDVRDVVEQAIESWRENQ